MLTRPALSSGKRKRSVGVLDAVVRSHRGGRLANRAEEWPSVTDPAVEAVEIPCRDGVRLGGHLWRAPDGGTAGTVVVNPATGVLAALLPPLCAVPRRGTASTC